MLAARIRAKELEQRAKESAQTADSGIPGELEARPVGEIAKVTECGLVSTRDHGMTQLMRAACDGLAGTVQALLDRGVEVNASRADGFNALALAAFFGHSQVVWLLLENGADLAATGRSKTPPEKWADSRGLVDIGDLIREARATKQTEASNARTAVIDEPARFHRSAEKEPLQPAGDPGPRIAGSMVDEAAGSQTSSQIKPGPVTEEGIATISESTADVSASDKPADAQPQPVIERPQPALKTLPEIEDPPPLMVPKFHPGSAFVARITSSRRNLVALIVAVWLISGAIAALLSPQIRTSMGGRRTEAVSNPPNLRPEPSSPVAGSRNVSPVEAPTTAATELPSAPAAKDIEETTAENKNLVSTSQVDVSERGTARIEATKGAERQAPARSSPSAGNSVFEQSGTTSSPTSLSRSGGTGRKQRPVSRTVKFKPQTVVEEHPKPAPLSVETSGSDSEPSAPARSANAVPGSQPPPPGIISGKPKSKVIQWP